MNHNMTISKQKFLSALFAIALTSLTIFSGSASAWDRSTEGTSSNICRDCLKSAPLSNWQYGHFRKISEHAGVKMLPMSVFSADPNSETWVDSRDRMNFVQEGAIVVLEVSGETTKPPRDSGTATGLTPSGNTKKEPSYGTGFMISECLALTNHHVANLDSNEADVKNRDIKVYAKEKAADGSFELPKKVSASIVASGNYQGQEDRIADWTVIKLDQPRRDKTGIIPLCFPSEEQAMDASEKGRIMSASFFPDLGRPNDGKVFGKKSCQLHGKISPTKRGWQTDCPSLPGSSGSPILAINAAGKVCALGMLTGAAPSSPLKAKKMTGNHYNIFIPFFDPQLKEDLKKVMEMSCEETTRT